MLPDSSPVTRYIQQLGNKLVQYAPGYRWPYQFHVVDMADINAFALPGGAIFVNLGTIPAAGNEAQLAGVIAHEISHVVLRHATCNLTKQRTPGMLAGIGQIAAGVLLGGGAGALAAQGIGAVAGLSFLKMSRDAEKQADLLGTDMLYDAGYDPRGMAQFFEIIQGQYGEGSAQLMSDHPNPGNRTAYVNDEIATLRAKNTMSKLALNLPGARSWSRACTLIRHARLPLVCGRSRRRIRPWRTASTRLPSIPRRAVAGNPSMAVGSISNTRAIGAPIAVRDPRPRLPLMVAFREAPSSMEC